LADIDQGVVSFFVAFFESINAFERFEGICQLFYIAGDAYKLIAHGFYGFDNFLPLQGICEIGDNECEISLIEVGIEFGFVLLFIFILLEQSSL
jgi:hypothetical protein